MSSESRYMVAAGCSLRAHKKARSPGPPIQSIHGEGETKSPAHNQKCVLTAKGSCENRHTIIKHTSQKRSYTSQKTQPFLGGKQRRTITQPLPTDSSNGQLVFSLEETQSLVDGGDHEAVDQFLFIGATLDFHNSSGKEWNNLFQS